MLLINMGTTDATSYEKALYLGDLMNQLLLCYQKNIYPD